MTRATFSGGVHPQYHKDRTSAVTTTQLELPEVVAIALHQHIGAPARACVAKGDRVLRGQPIANPGGFVSAAVHASISGTVAAIEPRPGPMGKPVQSVVIESDGADEAFEQAGLGVGWAQASNETLIEIIQTAGIVGMGGAAFPTHVKLSPPKDKSIDTVILNGAECEPYLTADHRTMLERPDEVLEGLSIVKKILNAKRAIIGIETNKRDAIATITETSRRFDSVEVVSLDVKYPQGAEKQLIDACLKRRVPTGGLPMDVSVVVQNVGTAAAISDAVVRGRALYERTVTVTGSAVAAPGNLNIRVGTPVSRALEACGGLSRPAGKLILGGPMMGLAQHTDEVAVTKGTSGILVLGRDETRNVDVAPCIRCGNCIRVCPMKLVPTDIARYAAKSLMDEAERMDALDCIECDSCAFDCPSYIPLVQYIRLAKAAILTQKRK